MGTRSTTKIYEDGIYLLCLYKQMDGYPEGWGEELKKFIKSAVSSRRTTNIEGGLIPKINLWVSCLTN